MLDWTSTVSHTVLPPPGRLALVLCPQDLPSPSGIVSLACLRCFGHPLASTISGYIIRPQEDLDCPPRGLATHGVRLLSGTKTPSGHPQVMSQRLLQTKTILTPGALLPRLFPVPGRQRLSPKGLFPTGHLSPALGTRPGHPCASNTLVAKSEQ
jgi:hypothetical protein